jgi:hypothetical protein
MRSGGGCIGVVLWPLVAITPAPMMTASYGAGRAPDDMARPAAPMTGTGAGQVACVALQPGATCNRRRACARAGITPA